MISPKIVLLIFVSGKIVLTGAKVQACFEDTCEQRVQADASTARIEQTRADIYTAFNNIYPVLTEFKSVLDPPSFWFCLFHES